MARAEVSNVEASRGGRKRERLRGGAACNRWKAFPAATWLLAGASLLATGLLAFWSLPKGLQNEPWGAAFAAAFARNLQNAYDASAVALPWLAPTVLTVLVAALVWLAIPSWPTSTVSSASSPTWRTALFARSKRSSSRVSPPRDGFSRWRMHPFWNSSASTDCSEAARADRQVAHP
jgi:hypothetical protein